MPQTTDPALDAYEDKLQVTTTVTAILRRLAPFVDQVKDLPLTSPMDLINAIYPRVRLDYEVREVENGNSWDYCKQAAIDWLRKQRRWIRITEEAYWYQLGCVPPAFQKHGLVLTGEEYSGAYHLAVYRAPDGTYWCCMLTLSECQDTSMLFELEYDRTLPLLGMTHIVKEVEP